MKPPVGKLQQAVSTRDYAAQSGARCLKSPKKMSRWMRVKLCRVSCLHLPCHRNPPGYAKHLSGNEGCIVACKKAHCADDVVGLTHAAERRAIDDLLAKLPAA